MRYSYIYVDCFGLWIDSKEACLLVDTVCTLHKILWFLRADIKQYIGLPSAAAVFKIYHSCIRELTRVGIISPAQQILDLRWADLNDYYSILVYIYVTLNRALEVMRFVENDATRLSLKLREIARWARIRCLAVGCILTEELVLMCVHCRKSEGLSGRTLRKIPFLAHALFSKVSQVVPELLNPISLWLAQIVLSVLFCSCTRYMHLS